MFDWLGCTSNVCKFKISREVWHLFARSSVLRPASLNLLLGFDRAVLLNT